ncbi:hypothetical protein WYH_00589 [Croceibacterium atlanticum]|uniref:Uncharacterized protein n=2 Tax=Croceibacterium atlanticum TaxID=1267766 RepID=A0A0F7KRA6_9SPHN|nr:hypothetical protein WYH_00589 [Croceibacterium atlanticum]
MYFLAENGLTSAVMADQIDPKRTNPNIPHVVHHIELGYGAKQRFMRKTVGVAFELADETYLPEHVDAEALLVLAIEIAASLASVMEVVDELSSHQAETRVKGEAGQLSAAYVPRTPNLKGKVRQSLAALRDVEVAIKKTTAQFYPKDAAKDPWDKKLKPAMLEKYGNDEGFEEFVGCAWSVMECIADHRHAMIHQDGEKSVTIYDYELDASGAFVAPTIEIAHPRNPFPRHDIGQFLKTQLEHIAEVYEALLGYMCDLNVRSLNEAFESFVTALPDGEQRSGSHLVWSTKIVGAFPDKPANA